jgi:hypothetical protein
MADDTPKTDDDRTARFAWLNPGEVTFLRLPLLKLPEERPQPQPAPLKDAIHDGFWKPRYFPVDSEGRLITASTLSGMPVQTICSIASIATIVRRACAGYMAPAITRFRNSP